MEEIESGLRESESKQRNLSKAYNTVRAQATSLINFSVNWKDLENHFESTRSSLETRLRELETREREIGARETQLEAKERSFHLEKESKAEELRGLDNLLDEKVKEVIDAKSNLHSLLSLIQEHSDEVIVQERRLTEVESFVRVRESKLESIERRIKERARKLNWVEKSLEDKSKLAECKEEEVEGLREALNKYAEDIEVKEMELDEIVGSVEAKMKELDLKEELIKEVERSIEERDKELRLEQEKLKAIQISLGECSKQLELREKAMRGADLKGKEFGLLKRSMEERSCKLEFKARELELKEERVKHLEVLQKSIEECDKELILKEEKLKAKQNSLVDCSNKLELREKAIREMELKERDFGLLKSSMDEWSSKLEFKARQLELKEKQIEHVEELQKSIQDGEKHLDTMSQGLKMKERQLEDQAKEISLKHKELDLIKKSAEERTQNLEFKERQLKDQAQELELKEKEFVSIKKTTEKQTQILKVKERQLEVQAKELELKQKDIDSIKKSNEEHTRILNEKESQLEDQAREFELNSNEFVLIKKSTEEQTQFLKAKKRQLEVQSKELELKQKDFDLIKKSHEEHTRILKEKESQLEVQAKELELKQQNLKTKERQLEDQSKELELKQKEFDLIKKSTEEHTRNLKAKENTSILRSQVKIEQLELIPSCNAVVHSCAINESSIKRDGRGLQLFMNEHLKRIDTVGNKISAVLKASSDPAKLVLDAMQGFYPSNSTVDNMECDCDLRVIRRSCILLLEALKGVSPQINPQVREEAVKLAGDWKSKMRTGSKNWLEVLGFLRLVTVYEICSAYDAKELQNLIGTIAECEQATELYQALGSTDKASASMICSPVKTEKPESSLVKDAATVSSPNLQPTATTDARNLQGFLDVLSRGNPLIQNETLAALQMSLDPAKFVLDVMQNSFPQYWRSTDVHYKETVMLSYINLLEQLMGVLPHGVHVKHDALKLAVQWKEKMGADTQNPLELLGFLQFITTYGVISSFTRCEIVMLLGRISQHKQTRELCQRLAFANKIPACFVQNLIETKQLIEAVRLICTFKLADTFPPVPLLRKFVDNTMDSSRKILSKTKSVDEMQDKVIDDEIGALRAAIQCIKDCNLQSAYPSENIEIHIVLLEKLKEDRRLSSTSLACKVGQQVEKKSLICEVELREQTDSLAFKVDQGHKKAMASNVEQEQSNLPSKVGRQEPHKFEQQKQQSRNKRRDLEQQQQQHHHQNKFQRTSNSESADQQ